MNNEIIESAIKKISGFHMPTGNSRKRMVKNNNLLIEDINFENFRDINSIKRYSSPKLN